MSNNARVVDGGEIGVAQYLQARAAGIEPDVRMNPILVKPEGDDRSQLVVLGKVDHVLSRRSWRERPPTLWPVAKRALGELLSEYELVVLEGAGSPAETNLRSTDLSNMRAAHEAQAPVVLVADIDRGGAFAHLHGTWSLVTAEDRELIHGFVLNKFRGDESLLAPAPADLEQATGMRYVGLLPFVAHGLPDEDGAATPDPTPSGRRVGIVRYPTASNLDEFKLLEQVADVSWVGASGLTGAVRPGRASRLEARCGRPRLAPRGAGVRQRSSLTLRPGVRSWESAAGSRCSVSRSAIRLAWTARAGASGCCRSRRCSVPRSARSTSSSSSARSTGLFAALGGHRVEGYEIRHGETTPVAECWVASGDRAFAVGSVLGVTAHGVLGDPAVLAALVRTAPPARSRARLRRAGRSRRGAIRRRGVGPAGGARHLSSADA